MSGVDRVYFNRNSFYMDSTYLIMSFTTKGLWRYFVYDHSSAGSGDLIPLSGSGFSTASKSYYLAVSSLHTSVYMGGLLINPSSRVAIITKFNVATPTTPQMSLVYDAQPYSLATETYYFPSFFCQNPNDSKQFSVLEAYS